MIVAEGLLRDSIDAPRIMRLKGERGEWIPIVNVI